MLTFFFSLFVIFGILNIFLVVQLIRANLKIDLLKFRLWDEQAAHARYRFSANVLAREVNRLKKPLSRVEYRNTSIGFQKIFFPFEKKNLPKPPK